MPLPLSTPPAGSSVSRRARPGVLGALLLAVFAANCGLDKLTGDQSAASTVRFAVSGDSVLSVGVSRPFAITPSEPVNFSNVQLSYDLSDSTLARVDSVRGQTAWVTGLRNGQLRVRLTARSAELPGGRVDSARVRIRFAAVRIDAIDTIAGLGPVNNANTRTVVVRGTRPDGSPAAGTPTVPATVISRDTVRLRATTPGGLTFVARDTGLVWLVASFDGAVDSVRVPIRRRLTRVVADSLAFGALFTSRSAPVRILDAGDSAIVGTPFRFVGLDTVRLQVDSTGPGASPTAPRLRARVRDTASYQIQTGALTSTRARTRVQQVPAGIVLAAGGGQSVRYGTAVPVAPRLVVRDSGQQGIGGVTVTFSVPNPGNGSITGASATTNAAGEAAVGGWVLGPNSGTDSLVATVGGVPPFVVTATALAGQPARVRFVQQPLGGSRNGRVQPAPQVAVVDSVGNVVASATDTITVARVGAAGGALTGTLSVAAVSGVARFDSLVFADTATAARLVASLGTLGVDTSAAFPIGRAPTQLVFTTGPGSVAGGSLMAPVTLELRDATGARAVGASDTVTVSMSNTLSTLTGTLRRPASAGVVTFNDLRAIGGGGQAFQIVATTASGLSAISNSFNVNVGPPTQLRFRTTPANVGPGVPQSLTVAVTDSGGNDTQAAGTNITLRLGTNPGSATLTDTIRASSFGRANFSSAVSQPGVGYTIVALSPGLTSATSAPFTVQAPTAPVRLRWLTKSATSNQAGFGIPVGLELVDAAGIRSTVTNFPYTLSILAGPSGAVLTAPTDSAFTNGLSFPRTRVRTAGTYRFIATAPGFAPDTTGTVQFFPAPGTRLTVLSQPTATGLGSPVSPVQVALTDSLGNVSTFLTNGTSVGNTLSIAATATGAGGGAVTLGGTTAQTTTGGVATFADLTIAAAGAGYRLNFSSATLTAAQSDTFSVRAPGTPVRVRLSALPATINGGSPINPVLRVAIVDSVGTTVATRTDSISLALRGPSGAVLSGPIRVAAVNGIALFPGLAIPRADTGLRIVATSNQSGIVADSTPTFRVNVGPVVRLRVLQSPTTLISGAPATPAIRYAATDSGGNTVVTASDSIGLQAFTGGTFWSMGGRNGASLVNGVAQFDSVVTFATTGNSVRFTPFSWRNVGYAIVDSTAPVTVTVGAAARVRISWGSNNRLSTFQSYFISGNVVDVGGNSVTTAAVPVTLSIIGTGGAVAGGTTTATSANGVWQMSPVSISAPGTYRWVVTSPGLAPDTSFSFVVTGRAKLARIVQAPTAGVRNGVLGPVRAILVDSLGQGVRVTNVPVTIALSGGGTLNGTRTVSSLLTASDTAGTVIFTGLATDAVGSRRLLTTVSLGPVAVSQTPVADSVSLAVAAYSAPQSLQFLTQPTSLLAGATMSTSPVVAVIDSVGNLVADSVARSISLSLQQGVQPGTSTPTNGFLTGSLSVTPAPGTGTASFANLSVNNPGNGYSLVATTNLVNAAQSSPFNVVQTTDAIALRFISTTVPTTSVAGGGLTGATGALAVEVINSTGARVTTSSAPITLSVQGGRAAIAGTAIVTAVNGLATFSSATIQRADTGYVLTATSPTLNTAIAPSRLAVAPSTAVGLRALDSLPTVVGGTAWPALRVAVVDAFQNVVTTSAATVTLRGPSGFPGDSSYVTWGGTSALAPTAPLAQPAVSGVATFTGLRPRFAISNTFNRLFFDSPGLTSVVTRFAVLAGEGTTMRIGTDTSGAYRFKNNEPIPAYVFVLDSVGNCAASSPAGVTLGLRRANLTTLPAGVSLSGASNVSTTGCFTRFTRSIVGVTAPDTFQIVPTAAGLTFDANQSRVFPVDPFGAATQLGFLQEPTTTAPATTIAPPVRVGVLDAFGNVVSNLSTGVDGLTGTVSVSLPNASLGGATTVLAGSAAPANIVNGVATFSALQVNNAASGYQLRAAISSGTTVPGVTAAVLSALFNIISP